MRSDMPASRSRRAYSTGASVSPASASANPQSGEPEAGMFTLPGDVNPIDSGDYEEVQEG
jgi:hypothetical protein